VLEFSLHNLNVVSKSMRINVSVALLITWLSGPDLLAQVNGSTDPAQVQSSDPISPDEARRVREYWTPERMRNAKPVPMGVGASPMQIQPTGVGQAGSGIGTVGTGRVRTIDDMQRDEASMKEAASKFDPFAGTPSAEEQKAISTVMSGKNPRKTLTDYTRQFPRPQGPFALSMGTVLYIDNQSLERTIPYRLFYVLRFRQWPISANLPPPFASNNIFVVDPAGKVEMITNIDKLNEFFERDIHGVKSEVAAKDVLKAWLELSKELAQDGMFHFQIPESEIVRLETHELGFSGKALVEPTAGNSGQIDVAITFDASGIIKSIKQSNNLRAGMRPICQSTKLLDSDPIVRKMAEQDLLIMGKDAKPYLDEQRAKLSPALCDAIDKIWQQILIEGR
jgi:hypothetical protein